MTKSEWIPVWERTNANKHQRVQQTETGRDRQQGIDRQHRAPEDETDPVRGSPAGRDRVPPEGRQDID